VISVTSALKKVFSVPCGQASAAEGAVLAERGVILLDVREPHEWQTGHALGRVTSR
jgi:rhodanese-related sulfurtransferase